MFLGEGIPQVIQPHIIYDFKGDNSHLELYSEAYWVPVQLAE